jgi:hypothetical protein
MNTEKHGFLNFWLVISLVVMTLTLAVREPANAQDGGGLSAEQEALIDRFVRAQGNLRSYSSYVEEAEGQTEERLTFRLSDQSRFAVSSVVWSRTVTTARSEGLETVEAIISAAVTETSLQAKTVNYTLEAQARRINETLYVNAAYATPAPDLPELPGGWVIVEDPDSQDIYEHLFLEDLFEHPTPYDNAELLKAAASEVTLERQTLEDGTAVDVITLAFDHAGARQLLAEYQDEEDDPALTDLVLEMWSEESFIRVTLALDANDRPYRFTGDIRFAAVNIDVHALSPDDAPEGMTLDITTQALQMIHYSQFNEPAVPATVPD